MRALLYPLLLALLLTACGQQAPAPQEETEPPVAQEETPPASSPAETETGDRDPAAEELGREETAVLEMSVEGEIEEIPATLYVGQGYSLYIPDEDWTLEEPGLWRSAYNELVTLQVLSLTGVTGEETAAEAVLESYQSYGLEETEPGTFTGVLDGTVAVFTLAGAAGGNYYYTAFQYPEEAIEGFGARLPVIAATLELHS